MFYVFWCCVLLAYLNKHVYMCILGISFPQINCSASCVVFSVLFGFVADYLFVLGWGLGLRVYKTKRISFTWQN